MILWGNFDDFNKNIEDHQWLRGTFFQNIDVSLTIHLSLAFGSQIQVTIGIKMFSLKVRISALSPFKSNSRQLFSPNMIGNDVLKWKFSNFFALNSAVENVNVAISSLVINHCFVDDLSMFHRWIIDV